jgi:hypothetical protein
LTTLGNAGLCLYPGRVLLRLNGISSSSISLPKFHRSQRLSINRIHSSSTPLLLLLSAILIRPGKHPHPTTIRHLNRPICIRPALPNQEQQKRSDVVRPAHPPLRHLARPKRRAPRLRHLARIRPRRNHITPHTPRREERRQHLAHVRGARLARVVGQARGAVPHERRDGGRRDDVRHAVVVGVGADGRQRGGVLRARVGVPFDAACSPAAARVRGGEEREEGRGDPDHGLCVDFESQVPAGEVLQHRVLQLVDGVGFVKGCAVGGAQNPGVVDQDVDVASLLCDLGHSFVDGGLVGYIAGYGGKDGGSIFRCRRRGFEGFDRVFEDVQAAAEKVYLRSAILIKRRRVRETDACAGVSARVTCAPCHRRGE